VEKVKINAQLREEKKKGGARKLRAQGYIPAVLYGKGMHLVLKIPPQGVSMLKSLHFSESTLIEVEIENAKKKEIVPALIKAHQLDPLSEETIHIDFIQVSLKEKIEVMVPLVLKGEAVGTKQGGVLAQVHWELEVEGYPLDIPAQIEVNIAELDIGDSLHVSDVEVPSSLKVLTPSEEAIVTLSAKKEEEELEEAVVGEETQEPEVIKEKPKEEEAGTEKPKEEEKKAE